MKVNERQNNKVPLVQSGDLLYETMQKVVFLIAGMSYDELALVRLLDADEAIGWVKPVLYKLHHDVTVTAGGNMTNKLVYADTSRLIIKEYAVIEKIILVHSERLSGSIHQEDLNAIKNRLLMISTISRDIKNKYLQTF